MYTGLCMTKVHCDALHARLLRSIRSAMLKDDDDLFEPRLQVTLQKTGEDGKNGEASNKPDAKKKAGKKGDPDGAMEPDAATTKRKVMGGRRSRVRRGPSSTSTGAEVMALKRRRSHQLSPMMMQVMPLKALGRP